MFASPSVPTQETSGIPTPPLKCRTTCERERGGERGKESEREGGAGG